MTVDFRLKLFLWIFLYCGAWYFRFQSNVFSVWWYTSNFGASLHESEHRPYG